LHAFAILIAAAAHRPRIDAATPSHGGLGGISMSALREHGASVAVVVLLLAGLAATAQPARADDAMDARQLVERAKLSFESILAMPDMDGLRDLLRSAQGVFIAPQVLRGAFIFGVSGGSGILFSRGEAPGTWNGPAFYTIGGVSFGFQAGADASEIVLLAMTERGVNALLSTSVKLGVDASVAAGPVGVGVRGATANVSVDIVSFSRSKGLYGGVSVDGAVVATRSQLNTAYYGREVSTRDILIRGTASDAQAAPLIGLIRKATAAQQ
jgi:lipid-binding SYLF domain-containing protein